MTSRDHIAAIIREPRVKEEMEQINELLADNFTCAICLDIFEKPIKSVKCGHIFCMKCLNDWLNNRRTCPHCRQIINALTECPLLEKVISRIVSATTEKTTTQVRRRQTILIPRQIPRPNSFQPSQPIPRPVPFEVPSRFRVLNRAPTPARSPPQILSLGQLPAQTQAPAVVRVRIQRRDSRQPWR